MDAGSDAPPRPSATGTEASTVPAAAGELPARRRRGEVFVAGTGAGATGAAAVKGAAAGAGSGKGAAGTVSVTRAAVRAGEAALSTGAGKSSQSSSPGSTTRPPPDDDRPYSAARRSASAASAAASMGRPASCGSGTGAAVTASPADAEEASAAFLRPRPPEADARPARVEALRPAAGRGCSSPGTGTAASATAASRTATDPAAGGAVRSTAPDAGAGPVSGTGAAFELPVRRRRGEVFVAGAGTGAGAAGGAAVKGGAAGTGSGQGVAGTVSVTRAAVRAGEAALSAGAGRSSQSSSPGSTTRPPPDDDRPYSAARRSASAASAAASMGRPASCGSGTGAAVTASPADAEEASAAFLRPRPPEADARPARVEALRPAAGRGCSSPGTDTAASAAAASRTAPDPAACGAVCSTAPDAGAGPVSATGSAFVLPARRRRAVVFLGEMAGSGGAAADVALTDGPSGGVSGAVSLPSETLCGGVSATVRGPLSGAARFFRPLSRSREGTGLAVCCASRPSAGVFSTGSSPCVAFFPFPAVFSGREGDGSRPQASNNERAVAVMTVTRLRDNRLLESSPAAGDRPGAASEGEDMELLDYIQIG